MLPAVTSLLCWVGVDSRGPTSAYIATDSRITWGRRDVWDLGRKTFAASRTPDIFGFSGGVLFPSLVLSQYVSALDAGLHGGNFQNRFQALEELVRVSFAALPPEAAR